MISFKEYLLRSKSILDWDSAFGEQRSGRIMSEAIQKMPKQNDDWHERDEPGKVRPKGKNNKQGVPYNSAIHDHEDVVPKALTEEHKTAIQRYTAIPSEDEGGHGSSANMNAYLRNKQGNKKQEIQGHNKSDVEKAVKTLSSAFSPENTNKKPLTTYSAIPKDIGTKLQKSKPDSKHVLAGFTSTSTDKDVVKNFSDEHFTDFEEGPKVKHHFLHCTVQPGAGLSVVHHSEHAENEILLHHGAHATYSHTEVHKNQDGSSTHVHHVVISKEHEPLEKYGKYTEAAKQTSGINITKNNIKDSLKHPDEKVRAAAAASSHVSIGSIINILSNPNEHDSVKKAATDNKKTKPYSEYIKTWVHKIKTNTNHDNIQFGQE